MRGVNTGRVRIAPELDSLLQYKYVHICACYMKARAVLCVLGYMCILLKTSGVAHQSIFLVYLSQTECSSTPFIQFLYVDLFGVRVFIFTVFSVA